MSFDVGYNSRAVMPSSLTDMFASSAKTSASNNVSSFSFDSSGGPISILSGQPTPELPTVHDADIGSGSNAGANIQNADTVSAKQGQVTEAKANFAKMTDDVQRPLQEALKQGALDCSFNPQTACNSFMPPPPSCDVIDVGLNAGAPGVMTVAEVLNMAPKLTAKEEQQLAARVSVLLTPTRDAGGQVVKEAPIPNLLVEQQRLAEVEFLKQALRPVEQQPEYIAMLAVEKKLENAAADHAVQNPKDQAVVTAAKEAGFDVAAIDARAPTIDIEQIFLTGGGLAGGLEVKNVQCSVHSASILAANDPVFDELRKQHQNKAPGTALIIPPPFVLSGQPAPVSAAA